MVPSRSHGTNITYHSPLQYNLKGFPTQSSGNKSFQHKHNSQEPGNQAFFLKNSLNTCPERNHW